MRARAARAALVAGVALVGAVVGCAGRRLDDSGTFRSEHGYRVTVPSAGWSVVGDTPADIEVRRADGRAAMLAAATCRAAATRAAASVLGRHLLLGLRDRETLVSEAAALAGRRGIHVIVEGRMQGRAERVRVESYTVKDTRCVYDLMYAAPVAVFDTFRTDFERFVQSFTAEG
ncbi:MAG TPA: hypothetical protein VHZ49_06875 [Methylomirabilota bacterium]|nr:hypothetical protein [Methylomirabilota bacterium]